MTLAHGRPVMMFNVPETYGTQDYLVPVDDDKVKMCEDHCTFKSELPCDEDIFEMCCILMEESGLSLPHDPDEAVSLYKTLRRNLLQAL